MENFDKNLNLGKPLLDFSVLGFKVTTLSTEACSIRSFDLLLNFYFRCSCPIIFAESFNLPSLIGLKLQIQFLTTL